MYSDDCRYRDNVFRRNGAGVAVMYTKQVEMTGNRFEDNWGSAAYGLLLKEISDPVIVGNRFARNTVGLVADGAMRLDARNNAFLDNGWAVRLMGSTVDGRFTRNEFIGNTFDVATNSREPGSTFDGNYWDAYRGYDLDRDGRGDVPHHPVRLFSYLVSQNEPSLILLRSLFVEVLDAAERVLPALTPETLVDAHPAMRRFK
jgi:nitrous oxidase accessory protein